MQVIGAGVIGLSCAIRLLEAGHDVRVIAARRTPDTTSDVAAALHYPFLAEPQDLVNQWAAKTMAVWPTLPSDAGVSWVDVIEHFDGEPAEDEAIWQLGPERVPEGLRARSALIDMRRYMPWLEARVLELGGTIETRRLHALPDGPCVNAAGLGARELVADAMQPLQGQVVYTTNPGLSACHLSQQAGLTYIMPFKDRLVIGGTADVGENTAPSQEVADQILDRARHLLPGPVDVLGTRVGIRPGRASIRLEREGDVIHCYGHGGSGVTVSWGCADAVAALA